MKRYLAASAAALALVAAPAAWAHAEISPAVAKAKATQAFTLNVPNEKDTARTTMVELTPPEGFRIDSVAPVPGWKVGIEKSGSGEEAQINRVLWSGGKLRANEATNFPFLAEPDSAESYSFAVRQTYSDGTVVDWSGPESSDTPAPVIEAKSSLGGGGSNTLAIVAIALGAVALVVAALGLLSGSGGRSLT